MFYLTVYILPVAGGSSNYYRSLQLTLRPYLTPVYLKVDDTPTSIQDYAAGLTVKLNEQQNKNGRYMIFGHSMGALLAYEMASVLWKQGDHYPQHIFLSSMISPSALSMLNKIQSFTGTRETTVEQSDKTCQQRDLDLINHYRDISREPLHTDASVFWGANDQYFQNNSDFYKWKRNCKKNCELHRHAGGHDYFDLPPILEEIALHMIRSINGEKYEK